MKKFLLTSAALLIVATGNTLAACSDPQITSTSNPTLTTLINGNGSGNTLCAASGNERWQEQHRPGGQLWDYKKGPSDPVDPTSQVGTWSIAGNNLVHTYGSTSYSYTVHRRQGFGANAFTLCGPQTFDVTFLRGITSCP